MSTGPLNIEPTPDKESASIEALPTAQRRELDDDRRRKLLPRLAVLGILALGVAVSALLFATRPAPKVHEPDALPPLVRIVTAEQTNVRVEVVAHGTVTPRTESDVIAEVRGRVTWVAPNFVAGGFFAQDAEFLRLDGREHEIAVDRARAAVKLRRSESRLAAADAERQRSLAARGAASAAALEQFESRAAVASASLDEARAQLAQAELDLERTVVRAAFDGRVRERQVDVGQFVNPGAKLGRVYAIDYAEVRLPIQTEELAHLDLAGLSGVNGPRAGDGASVKLSARLGGRDLTWPAQLSRTEGAIDLRTRMMHVVARVDDPYARLDPTRTPLPAGLFVRGEITGRELEGVYRFPVSALRDGDRIYVVDNEGALHMRPVEVVRRERKEVVIGKGVEPGDRVIVSTMHAVTDGMQVRSSPANAGEMLRERDAS